jgi:hypothetical protein
VTGLPGAAPTQTTPVPGTTSAAPSPIGAAAGQPDYAAYYLYLQQLYGYGGGGPPSPEAQAEVQNALTQYFSNGAAATSVPTSGPAAEYFTNGAAAVTEPTSVIPDYTFSPPPPAAPEQTAAPPEASPPPPVEEDAGVAPEPDAGAVPLETNGTEGTGGGPPQREPGNPTIGPTAAPVPVPAPPATIFLQAPAAEPQPPAPAPVAKATTGATIGYMLGGVGVGAFLVSLGVFLGPRVRPRSTST